MERRIDQLAKQMGKGEGTLTCRGQEEGAIKFR